MLCTLPAFDLVFAIEYATGHARCSTQLWLGLCLHGGPDPATPLERSGIEDFRWHDLRHTWASWHVRNGTPLNVLQELGGVRRWYAGIHIFPLVIWRTTLIDSRL